MAQGFYIAPYNIYKITTLCIAQNTEITCQFREIVKNIPTYDFHCYVPIFCFFCCYTLRKMLLTWMLKVFRPPTFSTGKKSAETASLIMSFFLTSH